MTEQNTKKLRILGVLVCVYLWLQFFGGPLILHNGYFDITEIKTVWFVFFSVLFLLVRLGWVIQTSERLDLSRFSPDPAEIAAAALCVTALLSSAASGFFWSSIAGFRGRWQGGAMLFLYAALFAAFRKISIRRRDLLAPLSAGLAVVGVLCVLDHFGLDPLGLQAGLRDADKGRFISTLGNINFAGAYLCLAFPPVLLSLLQNGNKLHSVLYGVLLAIGVCASAAIRSESVFLGLGFALMLTPLLLRRREELLRFSILLPLMGLVFFTYAHLARRTGAYLSSLTKILSHPVFCGFLLLTGALFFLCGRKAISMDRFRKIYFRIVCAAAAAGVLALLWLNTLGKAVPLGSLETWLRFSDEWGTDRVKVWKYCLSLYGEFPLLHKLLGGGCGILARMDMYRRIFPDAVLDAAHCEYLQILLNWGILGLGAYVVWTVSVIRKGVHSSDPLARIIAAGLAGYAFQALVNIAQAPGITLFFLMLALEHALTRSGQGKTEILAEKPPQPKEKMKK